MDLVLTPDTYTPSVDRNGNYVDKVPVIRNGLTCLCGTRKGKVYENEKSFSAHIRTKKHREWIESLNSNKANFYVKMIENEEIVNSQRQIISKLENDLKSKLLTIDYLTTQLTLKEKVHENINLLDL